MQNFWRAAALVLVVLCVGGQINQVLDYGAVFLAAVALFTGQITKSRARMVAAALVVGFVLVSKVFWPVPTFEEGHNVFLPGASLSQVLPSDVYERLERDFNTVYPPSSRCDAKTSGCWVNQWKPDKAFAFSADGIFRQTTFSRRSSALDTKSTAFLRLGFTNELGYNWYDTTSDIIRAKRDDAKGFFVDRWTLHMPWYEALRFPASFVGSELCWRGDVSWETSGNRYQAIRHESETCRKIETADIGKNIFGLSIAPGSLLMKLRPVTSVTVAKFGQTLLTLFAILAVVFLLLKPDWRKLAIAGVLIVPAALMILRVDSSFFGGLRLMEGGDDGLFYDGAGRIILRHLLGGDFYNAGLGLENVFYYGGPGLRYLRAFEHIVFGETFLGYLTILLIFPLILFGLLRHFIDPLWAVLVTLLFEISTRYTNLGNNFVQFVAYAERGYADSASYILFCAGVFQLIKALDENVAASRGRSFAGAFLLALALFLKPLIAPACAVALAWSALQWLSRRSFAHVAALVAGFSPMLFMPWHNWYFGNAFVLFSSNAYHPQVLTSPPAVYVAAAQDLLSGNLNGEGFGKISDQISGWLKGPTTKWGYVPFNIGTIAVLFLVVLRTSVFPHGLRLIAACALAQHVIALMYIWDPRYHLLTWLLTIIVANVWLYGVVRAWLLSRREGLVNRWDGWARRFRY